MRRLLLLGLLLAAGCTAPSSPEARPETLAVRVNNETIELPVVDGVASGRVGGMDVEFVNHSRAGETLVELDGPIEARWGRMHFELVIPLRNVGDGAAYVRAANVSRDGEGARPAFFEPSAILAGSAARIAVASWDAPDVVGETVFGVRFEFHNAPPLVVSREVVGSLRIEEIVPLEWTNDSLTAVSATILNDGEFAQEIQFAIAHFGEDSLGEREMEAAARVLEPGERATMRFAAYLVGPSPVNATPTLTFALTNGFGSWGVWTERSVRLAPARPVIEDIHIEMDRRFCWDGCTIERVVVTFRNEAPTPFVGPHARIQVGDRTIELEWGTLGTLEDGRRTLAFDLGFDRIEPGSWPVRTTLLSEGRAIANFASRVDVEET